MGKRANGGPTKVRLMNEYSVAMPLWDNEGLMDADALELSDSLRADLKSFALRWESSISPEVADDHWDGVPVMSSFVSARYSIQRLMSPTAQRDAASEDVAMRLLGEELRDRLQLELGDEYRVVYRH